MVTWVICDYLGDQNFLSMELRMRAPSARALASLLQVFTTHRLMKKMISYHIISYQQFSYFVCKNFTTLSTELIFRCLFHGGTLR